MIIPEPIANYIQTVGTSSNCKGIVQFTSTPPGNRPINLVMPQSHCRYMQLTTSKMWLLSARCSRLLEVAGTLYTVATQFGNAME